MLPNHVVRLKLVFVKKFSVNFALAVGISVRFLRQKALPQLLPGIPKVSDRK